MGGFFQNMYRLYGGDYDPYAEPDVGGGGGGMETVPFPEEQEPTMAPAAPTPRMIPPAIARPGMDQYLEHIRNAPTNKPSTLTTIMAGIGGLATAWGRRDPGAGFETTQKLLNTPYEQALQEWKAKGAELGKYAGEEGDYLGNVMDYSAEGGKLDARYAELETRKEQIQKNYDIALKNATTAEARVQAQRDRDSAMQTILADRNKIDKQEAGTKQFEAQTNRQRADAYGRYVDTYGKFGGGARVVPPSPDNMMKAEQDVLLELMASDPKFREFFQYDDEAGVTPIMGDWTPEQLAERQALMTKIGLETQKRLGGTAAGGAPPLWQMRPNVVVPPNRRRMP